MTGPACRRCGKVPGDAVMIYGRDDHGALVPRAAQCKGRCASPPSSAAARALRPVPAVTAFRPGTCAGCTCDIRPGDKIVHAGEGRYVHPECVPGDVILEEPGETQPGGRGREDMPRQRRRARRADAEDSGGNQ